MELLVVSFMAGVLTVAAPCVLPLLPVIIGGSAISSEAAGDRTSIRHPLTIVLSLAVSIVVFSLLLKASTALLGIPDTVWAVISGGIVLLFGITLLFPSVWDRMIAVTGWQAATSRMLDRSGGESGTRRDVLLGAALGPVFNSCSPTYALIIAVILPASFGRGFAYLVAYALGLAAILLLVSLFGRALIQKMDWLSDPHGTFRKVIGVIFVIVGIAVIFGIDRSIQTWVLDNGLYDPVSRLDESLDR